MTKEEAINLLKQVNEILINSNSWLENTHEPLNQAFDMAIKALEQQPCEDCVSRQAVIKEPNDNWLSGTCARRIIDEQINKVKELPPVTPTQSWIPVSENGEICNGKI